MESETRRIIDRNADKKPIYFDGISLPWETIMDTHLGKQFKDLKMIYQAETGLAVNLSVYPKGYYKVRHVHGCSHGIFVLSGRLKTDEGVFGPGTFVWYPEGTVMSHGATEDEDCLFLYIQDREGSFEYLE